DDENFEKGPQNFFRKVPAPLRPVIIAMVRRGVRKALHGHGMGRHSRAEIGALAARSIDAFADFLGAKPFFFGREPTGLDATASPSSPARSARSSLLRCARPRNATTTCAPTSGA